MKATIFGTERVSENITSTLNFIGPVLLASWLPTKFLVPIFRNISVGEQYKKPKADISSDDSKVGAKRSH